MAAGCGLEHLGSGPRFVPKGQKPAGSEGNREIFIVKKIEGAWKFYRYIFNAEVAP